MQEAAEKLGVRAMTVLRTIRAGHLPAEQYFKGTPWVIRGQDLVRPDIQHYANSGMRRPLSQGQDQQPMLFQ
ncbi:helix-turn-helix domain-containing protein [Mesorhizobium sp. M0659]|uniref:helix-turn-helix domain-containing protein n=1 Tax=Mesorhizobium sp. M0659 TaxID=2956980 RepID=UPI003336C731